MKGGDEIKKKRTKPIDLSASQVPSIQLSGNMMEVDGDNYLPNHMPFKGVLAFIDKPSDGPPNGLPPEFEGRPILLPLSVARSSVDSLSGMGINIRTTLDGHNKSHKIGSIEYAWVDDNQLKVSGIIYDKDFPEDAMLIKANKANLGMSFETTQTVLIDGDFEGTPVAVLTSVVFTGATILWKVAAAYQGTSLAANLQKEIDAKMEEKLIELLAGMKAMQEGLATMSTSVTGLDGKLTALEAQVVAVDAKVEDKVTTLSAALETVPKEGIKLEDISASITTIVKAELEAAKVPPAIPVRKTTPLARYGDVTGKDLEAAIHKSEGQPVDKIAALIMAEMLQAQSE